MSGVFRFKQFAINQQGCAMKINTDGVLLGALAQANSNARILDIGTGTGVIALMLAQRFTDAYIDAVELDETAAITARQNFVQSPFADRLQLYAESFQSYFEGNAEKKYDVIISNPPFYIQSLHSPTANKTLAKHADLSFFNDLICASVKHLHIAGKLWLILPVTTAQAVKQIATGQKLFLQQIITIHSYPGSDAHRELLAFGLQQTEPTSQRFIIYNEPKKYSQQYEQTLKDFFTIF
ncbi:methyltransferase [Mucilaginibacter sp. Bleaf8]|uniref:tRNA1(Val) (adenine(37)-N6)-methyltransferase n=1 Tax=Mucilaginibacter sp. Bleaf8 TaxID=2834430 RepID=UPI001BCF2C67|nr:methyltransferase [Mucilaginibacter sp. Bleaf8]MBS7562902.1 methyltransferase [Mucilaginibacter sp. Bleaf8]